MNEHEELELLDLEDDAEIEMPEGFEATPRPKRPWLLLGASLAVIALASYIIIRIAATDPDNVVDIRLDLPAPEQTADALVVPPQPETEPEPVGAPVRVVEDRAEATFNPRVEVPRPRPVSQQGAARPAVPAAAPRPAPTPARAAAPRPQTATGWMAQVGSYNTRESALAGERRLRAQHRRLFEDRQFVVLTAQVSGRTVHRLRVTGFASGNDAEGFCRNARSDGLDCFATR